MERLQGILSSISKIIGSPHVGKAVDNLPLALSTQGNETCSTGRRDMIVGLSAGSNLSGTQGDESCSTARRDRNLIVGPSAGANLSGVNVNARFRINISSSSSFERRDFPTSLVVDSENVGNREGSVEDLSRSLEHEINWVTSCW